jgi:hypothetical protein
MLYYNLIAPSQYGGAQNGQRTLQQDIIIISKDNAQYAIGFSGDDLPTTYFVVPKSNETWANGLDDKKHVPECLALFETERAAQERMNDFVNNTSYQHGHLFKTKYHQDQSLELVLISTSSK